MNRKSDEKDERCRVAVRARRSPQPKNHLHFVWDFGDGKTYQRVEPSYSFTTNGSYVIKVTAIKLDCTVSLALTLNVEAAIAGNGSPIAIAGTVWTTGTNTPVFLSSRAASDPDGDPFRYHWAQIFADPVLLLHANKLTETFISPSIPQGAELVFGKTVGDGQHNAHVLNPLQPEETALVTFEAGYDPPNVPEGQTVTPGVAGRGLPTASNSATRGRSIRIPPWYSGGGPRVRDRLRRSRRLRLRRPVVEFDFGLGYQTLNYVGSVVWWK